ncbi:facilitated trehalose transporter Tret1-like isoform X2 [Lycorma delicatula]|uniref:facilitated trehalose transporter Tret1-like isoform X2 n=1 Tax=Lycorma delicatula TaxID=130591 RepID=UPI003F519CD4
MGTESVSHEREYCMLNHSRLYFSAFAANLAYFSCGCSLSWTSPSLPKLMADGSWLQITEAQGSWVGSLLMLGGTLGAFLAGPALDMFGRKRTFQGNTLLLLFGWFVLGSANSLAGIFIGRFLQGIAVAIYFTAIPLYLGEIAEKSQRAAIASCSELFVSCGYMLEYIIGPSVTYTTLVYCSCIIPLISLFLFLWIPESPYYLLAKGRRTKAMKWLSWLRGNVSLSSASEELALIQASLQNYEEDRRNSFSDLFTNYGNLRALYLANGLLFLQQFSGINVVLFYAQPIFMKTGASFSSSVSAMIVGAVQTMSACFTPPLVKRYGFKPPLLVSASGMTIAQGVLGLYFYLEYKQHDMSSFGLIPVSCLVLYIHTYCLEDFLLWKFKTCYVVELR